MPVPSLVATRPRQPQRSLAPRRPARFGAVLGVAALAVLGLSSCAPAPTLSVAPVVTGLDVPWDLAFTPGGSMLFTERAGRLKVRTASGTVRQLNADFSDIYASGETGLMGIEVDPGFASNGRFFTCQGFHSGTTTDIRVVPWTIDASETTASRSAPIVTGLPVSSGRHGGCRLRNGADGYLWVGTGDAAIGTNPQDLTSLGGKVLRVDRSTGAGAADNPLHASANDNTRRIWSYGHRNVQGLARHPDGTMWTVEQGTDRDDEVNIGWTGNYGYDPVPGYNESLPMTDLNKFPSAVPARWSSGYPTVATSGAAWLDGNQWGSWNRCLAVAALKDTSLKILCPDKNANLIQVTTALDGTYGRLRTAQMGPDGALYVTTSNGGGQDQILRMTGSVPQ